MGHTVYTMNNTSHYHYLFAYNPSNILVFWSSIIQTVRKREWKDANMSYLVFKSKYTATINPASQLHASHVLTCLK